MALQVYPLPTLDRLGATVLADTDPHSVAAEWLAAFASFVERDDVDGILNLFLDDSHWRDMLALTWDFRTFHGSSAIRTFLADRLASSSLVNFRVKTQHTLLQRPYPDLAWVCVMFDFDAKAGACSGVVRLVPTASGAWKAHCMFTNLEELAGFPAQVGPLRDGAPNHGKWAAERARSLAFDNEDPAVLIIGAGHSGLGVAARLKYLGVRTLVVEKNKRVGDSWRNRYDALCLHDPVYYDHLPYLQFPPTWPVYTPASKLGNWLEHYAEVLELDVWTSSTVLSARPNSKNDEAWEVIVERAGGQRTFTVRHVVFASGVGTEQARVPDIVGMQSFKGEILHSTQHKSAKDHAGKKVVVVGACTSAHDIAADCYDHGVDVTIYQRTSTHVASTRSAREHVMKPLGYWENGPPVDIVDRMAASMPLLAGVEMYQRTARQIAKDDQELLESLRDVGFKLNMGVMDAGISVAPRVRGGGYYLDVGTSQLLIDGKIKLKTGDSPLAGLFETGLKFEDGTVLEADVVVFATGLGHPRDAVRKVCGDEVWERCGPIWGLDAEGEVRGACRDLGVPRLWYILGNMAFSRFHSKHLALQIKAMEEGIFGERYGGARG